VRYTVAKSKCDRLQTSLEKRDRLCHGVEVRSRFERVDEEKVRSLTIYQKTLLISTVALTTKSSQSQPVSHPL
jgi:hypothetical protein